MSYILDALRKSEEDRKRKANSPVLHASPPGRPSSNRDNRGLLFWVFAPVVLLLTAGSTYYFLQITSEDSATSSDQVQINPVTIPKDSQKEIRELLLDESPGNEEITATDANEKGEEKAREVANDTVETNREIKEKKEKTETAVIDEGEELEKPVIAENKKTPPQTASEEEISKEVIATLNNDEILEPAPITDEDLRPRPEVRRMVVVDEEKFTSIPYLEQLPKGFQETVPKFKLAGHVYSADPKRRMILINNSIFREKQPIAQGFFLEMITPDGVVLHDGETRFRLSAE